MKGIRFAQYLLRNDNFYWNIKNIPMEYPFGQVLEKNGRMERRNIEYNPFIKTII